MGLFMVFWRKGFYFCVATPIEVVNDGRDDGSHEKSQHSIGHSGMNNMGKCDKKDVSYAC